MSFIGPVNQIDGALVRPHDVAIMASPNGATREATVERLTHLGFEVRVELALADGGRLWSQITRDDLERMELAPRQHVFVEPRRVRTFAEEPEPEGVLVGG